MGVNGKILKRAISWKWLIIERNGWKLGTRGSLYCICRAFFMSDSLTFEFSLQSFGALCKIPNVRIFKRPLLPQFSSNFNHNLKKSCNPGKYRLLLFLAICQFCVHGTLKRSYLCYIAITYPYSYISFICQEVKQSVKAPEPLVGNCCILTICFSFSLTWDPMGVKISKCYSSHSYNSFSTKLFRYNSCGSPHKSCFYRNFEILNFILKISLTFSLKWDLMEVKIYSINLQIIQLWFFFDQLYVNVPCDSPHRSHL